MSATDGEVAGLYASYEKLVAAGDDTAELSKLTEDYEYILEASKRSAQSKQLAASFIPRFFKSFPELEEKAINAQIDLCEEETLNIRLIAIRGLPMLCKDTPVHLPKLADILGQLLLSEDPRESAEVKKALLALVVQDPRVCLLSLFSSVLNGEEELRAAVVSFLRERVLPDAKALLQDSANGEGELLEAVKKILVDVSGSEYKLFMGLLGQFRMFGKDAPRENMELLLDIVAEQAELHEQFSAADTDNLERLLSCFQSAIQYVERGARPTKFTDYLCKQLLPAFDSIAAEPFRVGFLQFLAQVAPLCTGVEARVVVPELVKYGILKPVEDSVAGVLMMEAAVYAFHWLCTKAKNVANVACGYQVATGQPSDKLDQSDEQVFANVQAALSKAEEVARKHLASLSAELKAVSGDGPEKVKLACQVRACKNVLSICPGLRKDRAHPYFTKSPPANIIPSFVEHKKQPKNSSSTGASFNSAKKRKNVPEQQQKGGGKKQKPQKLNQNAKPKANNQLASTSSRPQHLSKTNGTSGKSPSNKKTVSIQLVRAQGGIQKKQQMSFTTKGAAGLKITVNNNAHRKAQQQQGRGGHQKKRGGGRGRGRGRRY